VPETTNGVRHARCTTVSSHLAALTDQQIATQLEESFPAGSGIGGTASLLTVEGIPVFVKRVPLTDLERQPENAGSTANLFQLPTFYQYGIGSTGFGAWRELAVHTMTTAWVLENRFDGFPLLYHWRVVPQPTDPVGPEVLDRHVARWEGSPGVRARLTAINESSASLVLFMEHIPHTVHSWLTEQTAAGDEVAAEAYSFVESGLQAGVAFMGSQGLLHFDTHFHNLLTDGDRIYFADFGLAIGAQFDLDPAEYAFFRSHETYDRSYTATHFTHWLVSNLLKIPWQDCHDYLRKNPDTALPATAADIVARHREVAIIFGDFYRKLPTNLSTPYPAEDLQRAEESTAL
jgi:hypothetical protein